MVAAVLILGIHYWQSARTVETLAYSDFKTLLQAGKLSNLIVREKTITGIVNLQNLEPLLSSESLESVNLDEQLKHEFITIRVDDPTLIQQLQQQKIRYSGTLETTWLTTLISWIVPAIIFVMIWTFAMRRMGGGGVSNLLSIGKSGAKVFVQKAVNVKFSDVEGIDEAKQELMEVVEFLRTPETFQKLGGRIPKGILIVGAPGTGKTLLAKAVAGEAQVPFLSISGSQFVEMFVGVGAARVRDLFNQAVQLAPCIIFIDELDALGKARGIGGFSANDEREQTLNQLLVEMDGFDTNRGVIIMAATNRPEILDPALLRPGRFDRHVAIDRPDLKGRERILMLHAKRLVIDSDINLSIVAAKTAGFAGAELANIVNEAALHAARHHKQAVGMSDFEAAIDRAIGGLEKKNRLMTPKEKETVAYHEAGHALVAEFSATADRVAKVSIIPRGISALGFTQQLPTEDRYLLKRSELLDRLDVLLGGRGAELIIFKEPSTGAQNDLQRATDLARHMVTHYGMSEALGPAALDRRNTMIAWPEYQGNVNTEYSEYTAQRIDSEVQRLLQASEDRVRLVLTQHQLTLESLAKLLLKQETVDRITLSDLLTRCKTAHSQKTSLPACV